MRAQTLVTGMSFKTASPPRREESLYRALVVDDEPMVRHLLDRALTRTGFEVFEATDGGAALDLIGADEFDLVISDVEMPGIGGLELLQRVRLERPDLPVVLFSGHFELKPGQSAADFGAFAVLAKPCSIAEVQRTALLAVAARARSHIPIARRMVRERGS